MAASILSFGMLTARAFWIVRRRVGLEAGSAPPDLTAMVMSLAIRANCFAMRFQRANIVCLRTSNMRPMARMVHQACRACQSRGTAPAARRDGWCECGRGRRASPILKRAARAGGADDDAAGSGG